MPVRGKYGLPTVIRRRRRMYRRKSRAPAKSIPKLRKQLGVVVPETKVTDIIAATPVITTTLAGVPFAFQNLTQALTFDKRIGRAITIKRYMVRANLIVDSTTTEPGSIRLIFIRQYNPNNTQGSVNALTTAAQVLQTNTNIESFYQFDCTNTYQVLYDKTFSFGYGENAVNKYLQFSLPVSGKEVQWTELDSTANSANLKKNYIRGFIMYDGFGGVAPIYDMWQRVEYYDS